MSDMNYDVVIIGGGVTGCAAARELSRYDLRICLVEKTEDVCSGTTKANSAIVHAGYDAVPGTQKARFNIEGNRMMEALSKELDFEFKQNGSLILCFAEEDMPALQKLYGAESDGSGGCRPGCADRRNCVSLRTDHCPCRKCM